MNENRLKTIIKRHLPKPLHLLYNRIVSKRIIRKSLGPWFDTEWKSRAEAANTRVWLETYDSSWDNWHEPDLSPDDLIRIGERIPDGTRVLDAGCGDGYLLNSLRERKLKLWGCDLSSAGLKAARRNIGHEVTLVQSFVESMPFKDRAFDVVVTTHTLEHVVDFEKSVAELMRIAALKVIILVPMQEYLPYTEDYHLQFFPTEKSLTDRLPSHAICEQFTIPPGVCMYEGDLLLATIPTEPERE